MRSSAQGLFNLLILGAGNVVASFAFPALVARLTDANGMTDYSKVFLVPAGLATFGALILLLAFRPKTHGPDHEMETA